MTNLAQELIQGQHNPIHYIDSLLEVTGEGDCDIGVKEAMFPRLSKKLYKKLSSVLRSNSHEYGYCGCEHDCCGCTVADGYDIHSVKEDQTKLKIVYVASFNY